jgi:hypothetical protein
MFSFSSIFPIGTVGCRRNRTYWSVVQDVFDGTRPATGAHRLILLCKHASTIYLLTVPEKKAALVGEVQGRLLTGFVPDSIDRPAAFHLVPRRKAMGSASLWAPGLRMIWPCERAGGWVREQQAAVWSGTAAPPQRGQLKKPPVNPRRLLFCHSSACAARLLPEPIYASQIQSGFQTDFKG